MHYLAYGSNLHPLRLAARVPNASLLGTTRLSGYRLTFEKRSHDGSSKCHLAFTGNARHAAYGAVYEIPADEVALLDRAEGVGDGYYTAHLEIDFGGVPLVAFVYLASPSHLSSDLEPYDWYRGLVLAGARGHDFPTGYLEEISSVPSKPDPSDGRRLEMQTLLARLEA